MKNNYIKNQVDLKDIIQFFCLSFIILVPIFHVYLIIPFLLLSILKLNRSSPWVISTSLGIFSMFLIFPDDWDISRHLDFYSEYTNGESLYPSPYVGLDYVFRLFSYFNIDENLIVFLSCFILYFTLSKIALLSIKYRGFNKYFEVFVFMLFILSVPIIIFTGLRFSTGLALALYGVFFCSSSRFRIIVAFSLSMFFHFSFFVVIFLYLISRFSYFNLERKKALIIYFIVFVLSFFSFSYVMLILEALSKFFSFVGLPNLDMSVYFIGKWGAKYSEQLNSSGSLIFFIRKFLYVLSSVFFICFVLDLKRNKSYHYFCYLMILFCTIALEFSEVFVRYSYFSTILILFCFVQDATNKRYYIKPCLLPLFIYIFFQQAYYGVFAIRDVFNSSLYNLNYISL